ncbi:unnamed protein product [Caenorhabditis auriculariae]|uniref:Protein kinase domain-containing protein n=1 Tax=Caenorhabditis auriculariae TaxID=2777116 RepID=A0A8S1HJ26_9PELO|nr:unnamed protein product [Caenorhabditis auriculariae]
MTDGSSMSKAKDESNMAEASKAGDAEEKETPRFPVGVRTDSKDANGRSVVGSTPEIRIGKYVLVKPIGIGGNGDVYKVCEIGSNKPLILKVPKQTCGAKSVMFENIVMDVIIKKDHKEDRTIGLVRKLDSGLVPNNMKLEKLDKSVEDMFLVMESLPGSILDNLKKAKEVTKGLNKAIDYGIEMLRGVYDLHQLGMIHRDLKPENVGMFEDRSVVIFDMGMVRNFLDQEGRMRKPRTHVGMRGTDEWASYGAEVGGDQGPVDDLWGWFYTMVDNLNGFTDKNAFQAWTPYDGGRFAKDIACIRQFMKSPFFPAQIVLDNCPSSFYRIQSYLRTLGRTDIPDYLYLASLLKDSRIDAKRTMKQHEADHMQFLQELYQKEKLWF